MSIVTVHGVQYYVECSGAGPALLLLHGFTGSGATWAPCVAAWDGRFATIAVDFLGHGRSAAPTNPSRYGMAPTVADLAALLDALGVPQAHIVGYSMGGRVALHFAAAHPTRCAALVLESASPGLPTPAERAARVAADEDLAGFIEREGVPAFVERWERLPLWASQARLPAAVREALHAQRLANRAPGLAHSLRGLGTGAQESLHAALPGLELPVLCVAGALDAKFAAVARQMAAALPAGHLALVPAAGHAVHLEQPVPFARLVGAFLDECGMRKTMDDGRWTIALADR